jgi:homoserine acetyltransferase
MSSSGLYPSPIENDYLISNFEFESGQTLSELRIHYTTIGNPENPAVLLLHGTTGNAGTLLTFFLRANFLVRGKHSMRISIF